jgi:phosphatidylserine synthase
MNTPLEDVHASNLLTYVGLAAALAAVALAIEYSSFAGAGALLALAALADTFDGRFARRFPRTERQRRVGAQLDSLVDAIVFGLAPVVVASALPGRRSGMAEIVWWAAGFCYVLATVTRLSFFNVEQDELSFVGVPMPAIALIWSTCLLWPVAWWAVPIISTGCAVAMTAPVIIPRPRAAALTCFALWGVSLVALHAVRWLR